MRQSIALLIAISLLGLTSAVWRTDFAPVAHADNTAQTVPFTQNWANTGLITTNDSWSGVPGIEGYFIRNDSSSTTAVDPQTITGDTFAGGGAPELDVIANQTNVAITNGGVAEFQVTDPVVAIQGSGTADAPFLLMHLNTTGQSNISIQYNLRDIDSTTDNAIQPVALQFRVGNSGTFTNLPAGFVADATTGPSLATLVTPVSVTLPGAADNQPLVQVRVITTNAASNDEWVGVDDINVTSGSGDTSPSVSSTTPVDNATGVTINSDVTVSFSEAVNAPDAAFAIICASSGAHTFVRSTSDNVTFTLNPDSNFSSGEVCTVTVDDAQVTDQDANDPPDNMTADYVFDFTIANLSACGTAFTAIHAIQGSGSASPLDGTGVTTEGIVTAQFLSTGINGFYIQAAEAEYDADTTTSEGIFVFDGTFNASVVVGDRLRVTGTVDEFNGLTELTNITSNLVCSTGNALPAATIYDLPEPTNDDFERVENMLVTFPETLTVSNNFDLGRFGELVLSSDGRMFHQNSANAPGSPGSIAAADLNLRRYVVLDDGATAQNPDPTPYFDPVPTRRVGDTVNGLTGILTFGFDEYRVQPIPTNPPAFVSANPRPAAHEPVGGNLKVSSFNVLNYFNGDGAGGGFPTSRGADSAAEFTRQRNKIIAAMVAINADVFGVIELENDGGGAQSALQDLVSGLNAATAPGTYVGLHSPNPGTDLIQNAIIYKPASVTPVGSQVNDVDSAWDQARAPLAQTFSHNGTSAVFTFVVNHFTSKGCSASDTGGDADAGDGQGCDSLRRTLQANRLLIFVQDRKTVSGDNDVLVMGDLNAEPEEPPITTLEQDSGDVLADGSGGLVNQVKKFVPAASRYSLQFDARSNLLDYAMTTKQLNPYVSGTSIWHINADEPTVLDYNVEFKSVSQQAINVGTPYKSSDHDPVIVGLNLSNVQPQPAGSVLISEFRFRGSAGVEDEFVEIYNNTDAAITVSTTDGSAGWALVAADGTTRFTIPNGTRIPARGHFLGVNSDGYSLADYGGTNAAGGDITYTTDIPDASGIALFRTANAVNFTFGERLDAAGYTPVDGLYREGTGFPTGGGETLGDLEYSFLRSMTRATGGFPQDTGVNTADFIGVDTAATNTALGQRLGAPGPENLASPINRNGSIAALLLDGQRAASAFPNRDRDSTSNPSNNSTFGTMSLRHRFVNNTGAPVTRLRFRIVEVSSYPPPPGAAPPGTADLRAISSSDTTVNNVLDTATCFASTGSLSTPCTVTVGGTTLETPPAQPLGGGWNSTLSAGTITLATPLAPGASINLQFMLGVEKPGVFKFYVNIEALP